MTRCLFLLIFLRTSTVSAQLTPQQFSVENNQFVLAPQEMDVLLASGLIDSSQMQQLQSFFDAGGLVVNFYQLQGLLNHSTLTQIHKLLPFILLPTTPLSATLTKLDPSTIQLKAELRVLAPRLQQQQQHWQPTKDTSHMGSPFSLDWRFQLSVSNWRFGGHIAKDAGEPFWHQGKNQGFDFLSAYAAWKNPHYQHLIKKILFGAYQVQWGQGLQLWTSRGLGKSIDLLQLVRNPQGLQPYQSNDEQRFLQGAAFQLQKNNYEMLFFGSFKFTDAKAQIDTAQLDINFSYSSGFHRTATEIARRRLHQEKLFGLALTKRGAVLQSGFMLLYQQVRPRLSEADTIGSSLQIAPIALLSAGMNARATWRQFYFYGEAVICYNSTFNTQQNSAINLALIYLFDPKIEMGIHLRNYGSAYKALYANPIGNSSLGVNERGLIIHYKCQLRRYSVLKLLTEWAAQPFVTPSSKFPFNKQEVRLQFAHQSSRKNSFDCQVARRSLNAMSAFWQVQFNLTILPLRGQELELATQINRSDKAKGLSLIMACSWRYTPLNKTFRWELKYGLYHQMESSVLAHFYLLGVGAQTFALKGVGAFAMGAFRWSLTDQCQVQLHGIYSAVQSIPNQQKIQLGLLLRYQF